MNPVKRLIWCALLLGIQALYFPLNKYMQGGMEFRTPIDECAGLGHLGHPLCMYLRMVGGRPPVGSLADGRPIVRSVFHLVRGDAGFGVDHFYALPDLRHASHGACRGLVVPASELDLYT